MARGVLASTNQRSATARLAGASLQSSSLILQTTSNLSRHVLIIHKYIFDSHLQYYFISIFFYCIGHSNVMTIIHSREKGAKVPRSRYS